MRSVKLLINVYLIKEARLNMYSLIDIMTASEYCIKRKLFVLEVSIV